VARILSLKNDLVSIKDVANYHILNQSKKRQNHIPGQSSTPLSKEAGNAAFNVLMKSSIKSLY
jgi:hypothetical protein